MKKWRVEYKKTFTRSPVTYWVHRQLDAVVWTDATAFEPALPQAIPGKGFPVLMVNALGVELQFSSVEEAEHFLDVIRQRNMPSAMQLSKQRGAGSGPNRHWLSRLPARLKQWKKREKIIPVIEEGLREFRAIMQRPAV